MSLVVSAALLAGFALYLLWRAGEQQRHARLALASQGLLGEPLDSDPRCRRYNRATRTAFTQYSAVKQMPKVKTIVAVSMGTIRHAETRIAACEQCDRTADTRFDCVLASMTATPDQVIEYVMSEPAHCPACGKPVLEHHLAVLRRTRFPVPDRVRDLSRSD